MCTDSTFCAVSVVCIVSLFVHVVLVLIFVVNYHLDEYAFFLTKVLVNEIYYAKKITVTCKG